MAGEIVFRYVTRAELANFYCTYWAGHGRLPEIVSVARTLGANPIQLQGLLNDKDWRTTVVKRGVPLSARFIMSDEQFKCLAIITDPTRKGGLAARLKLAGVSYACHNNWMNQPEYRKAYMALAEAIIENSLADVNTGLADAATRGDISAIKFFYELTGRYNPKEQTQIDTMSVLMKVVEIISKHVTDPDTLTAIAGEMSLLTAVAGGNSVIPLREIGG